MKSFCNSLASAGPAWFQRMLCILTLLTFTFIGQRAQATAVDITLTPSSVDENVATGTAVGTLGQTTPGSFNPVFTLVDSGTYPDNNSFTIDGTDLKTAAALDYETKTSYTIRVQVDYETGDPENPTANLVQSVFVIVNNVNEAPTDISLDNTSIDENEPDCTVVGELSATDPDEGDTFTFSLVPGFGDNCHFKISGTSLKALNSFNYEDKSSYCIKVKVQDFGGLCYEEIFEITVNDVNDAPTNIQLSDNCIPENEPECTVIGSLSADDEDEDTLTFSLVSGFGDNSHFKISGTSLKALISFNYEVKSSYCIKVKVSDGNGGCDERVFTIYVENVNETPTDIALADSHVNENSAIGTVVGSFSSTDPENNANTYTLVSGEGSCDNALFTISGSDLKTAAVFNYEAVNTYSIRVKVSDGEFCYEEAFTISVDDVNEPPTDITLDKLTVLEQQTVGTLVGSLTTTDVDIPNGDSHVYTLTSTDECNDNAYFQIVGNQLQTGSNLVYSTRSTFMVHIRTTDEGSLYYEEDFIVFVRPLPGTPPSPTFTNDFSLNLNGWNAFPGLELTLDGSGHGKVAAGSPTAPTNAAGTFGGYESGLVADSGFTTSLDFNLDTGTDEGLKFGYLVALNNAAHVATNEFAFLVQRVDVDGTPGFRINTDAGLPGSFVDINSFVVAPEETDSILLTNGGWYTFQHWFHPDASTNLVAELSLIQDGTNVLTTWTINTTLKVPAHALGNRYAKIVGNEFACLLVDNNSLTTIPRPVALPTGVVVGEDGDVPIQLAGHAFPLGAEVTYKVTQLPLHGSVDESLNVNFADATIEYSPAADYFGTDSFKYVISNGAQDSVAVTVSITVRSINDAPSFDLLAVVQSLGITVPEDSATKTSNVVNTATVSKGAANESGQLISYQVTPDAPGLFMTPPTVSSVGTLSFRPAANVSGDALLTIVAMDNGGTACTGVDTSAPRYVTIHISPSNDAPVLATIANLTVNEGLTSTADVLVPLTLSDIETAVAGLGLNVVVSNATAGLVTSATAELNAGAWRVRLVVGAERSGSAAIHVRATDTGEGASPARSISRVFTFSVTAVNDQPGFVLGSGNVIQPVNTLVNLPGFSTFRANNATPADPTEAGQTGTYAVTVALADKAKFSVQPTISPAGVLNFKFAAGASGFVDTTVKVTDSGGTAGGGVNVSANQTLRFTVAP